AAVEVNWVNAEELVGGDLDSLAEYDGILVPGGFGIRGIEGKVAAARIAREQQVPYLGICLGMQVAVIEYSRNVAGLTGANSTEFDPYTPHPVIDLMPEQLEVEDKGGTMRLGSWPMMVEPDTLLESLYRQRLRQDGSGRGRHRHRYEGNPGSVHRLERGRLAQ